MQITGSITSVSSLRQSQGKTGETVNYCTIVVENKSLTGKRLGVVMECRGGNAEKVSELWQNLCKQGQFQAPIAIVDYESTIRTWTNAQGEERLFTDHVATNISVL